MISDLVKKLDINYLKMAEREPSNEELDLSTEFQKKHGMKGWEIFFHPETRNYRGVLNKITPNDVIFDIGAGDFRFDLILSLKVKKVYAIEINPIIVAESLAIIGYHLPENLVIICGNAFMLEIPSDVTVIICLMIHRQHPFPKAFLTKRLIYATHEGLIEVMP